MSLSTSSFRSEIRVIAVLAAVLLVSEIAVRTTGRTFSGDLRRASSIPARAEQLGCAEESRVLVLGNSLAIFGFDADVFRDYLSSNNAGLVHVQVETFRGSEVCEWRHIFKHFFVDTGRIPEVLILPLNIKSVRDGLPVDIGRLVYFCGAEDITDVISRDFHSFGDRVEFVHSYVSASFANREKVRQAVLDRVIPHYRKGERQIHQARLRAARNTQGEVGFTYEGLGRLLDLAGEHNVRVFCVAMPSRGGYLMDGNLVSAVKEAGMGFIDLRELDGLTEDHFRADGLHLRKEGAGILTRALARRILQEYPETFVPRKN